MKSAARRGGKDKVKGHSRRSPRCKELQVELRKSRFGVEVQRRGGN